MQPMNKPRGIRSLGLLWDAFLGREAIRLSRADLQSFYSESYLTQNPDLDAADSPQKSALLSEVCRLGGVDRAPTILEVGCGAGALLSEMKERFQSEHAVGVDYSGAIAGVARS